MKRSEYIAIGAVGLLAFGALWPRDVTSIIPGQEEAIAPDAQAFATVGDCSAASNMSPETCEKAFAAAQQASAADAPRFGNQASCESQYGAGQCRSTTSNGSSVFVPALIGMLVGRSLANAAQPQAQPLYPPRTGPANCPQGAATPGRPECATQSRGVGGIGAVGRTYSTSRGTTLTRSSGTDARVRVDARPRSTTTTSSRTTSRSGFGSTGRSFSSGG